MTFEWDPAKNQANISKHGVAFDTAKRIFEGPVLTWHDDRRAYGEERYISVGRVDGALLVIVHTERKRPDPIDIGATSLPQGKVRHLMKRYDRPLTPDQIDAVEDKDIDFSDIPELDEEFWSRAELVEPDRTEQVTIRVKRSVLDYFKAPGKGYQTRMNRVLESYVRARRQTG